MSSTPVDLSFDIRRKTIDSWAQAAAVSIIVVCWFIPLLLFWFAVWNDGQPFSMVGCTLCMTVGVLAFAIPNSYYRPKGWEMTGRIYRAAGVRWFKRWTPDGDYVVRAVRQSVPD